MNKSDHTIPFPFGSSNAIFIPAVSLCSSQLAFHTAKSFSSSLYNYQFSTVRFPLQICGYCFSDSEGLVQGSNCGAIRLLPVFSAWLFFPVWLAAFPY